MKDYRVTVKVRNNRLLKAIEDAGGAPGGKWCDENDLCYQTVNNFINMTISPINGEGNFNLSALRLCDVLNKLPQDIWSKEQLYPLEKCFSELEMDYSEVVALLPVEDQSYLLDSSGFDGRQTKDMLNRALAEITPREREVLRLRFEDDLTFEDIALKFDVSTARIQQIEAKALGKMRHPSLAGMFIDCVDYADINDDTRYRYKEAATRAMGVVAK